MWTGQVGPFLVRLAAHTACVPTHLLGWQVPGEGFVVRNTRLIASRYVHSYFAIDMLSSFPIAIIAEGGIPTPCEDVLVNSSYVNSTLIR